MVLTTRPGQDGHRRVHAQAPLWRHVLAVVAVLAYLAALGVGTKWLLDRWRANRAAQRGIAYGANARRLTGVDPWGINVSLEQYRDEAALVASLDRLAAGGFHTVRQRFAWDQIEPEKGQFDWEAWDRIVRVGQAHGLTIVAVVDGTPQWARAPQDRGNPLAPPADAQDFAAFAKEFALRYRASIDDYQIWDQPNIAPHWGARDPNPAAYVALVDAVAGAIRAADPGAHIVLAALAPTTELQGANLSEIAYLRGIYAAGGKGLFDVAAVQAYGFWSGPDDRQVDPNVLNFSRLVAVRDVMERAGDGNKPLWATAWGWTALPVGWSGKPSPWGNDEAERQYARDMQAITRARQEWPWLQGMYYAAWQPLAAADDPVWGLALLGPDGQPGALYRSFQALAGQPGPLYPGMHSWAGEGEIRFWGNRLELLGPGTWQVVSLDGKPLERALRAVAGQAAVVVSGLPAGEHRVELRSAPGPVPVRVGREPVALLPVWFACALALALAGATLGMFLLLRIYPWWRWIKALVSWARHLARWPALGLGAAALALLSLAPGLALSGLALAFLGLAILLRPDAGLGLAVFLLPLAPLQKRFGGAGFSYLEIVTLLTVGARLLWALAAWTRAGHDVRKLPVDPRRWTGLDWAVLAVGAAALLSLTVSQYLKVSQRELRVVVLQAGFIYCLITRARLERDDIVHLVDVLALSTVVVSLQGLYQYAFTTQVIVAEGVRRVRGIYGSPNNLALVLGRLFPLLLAVALCGLRGRRRWLYLAAALPTAICFFLTFSKGGWLLGLPAGLLVIGLLAGRKQRRATLGLAALALLGLIPLARTARFSSLFTLQGTSLLRIKLWEAAWDMVRDHPVRGVGLDNFLYHYPQYIRPEALDEPNLSHPHNWILDFWLRLGLPGLLAFLFMLWQALRDGLRLWRKRYDRALWAVNVGLLAGIAAMLAHGLIDSSFFVVELAALFGFALGLIRYMGTLVAEENLERRADAGTNGS